MLYVYSLLAQAPGQAAGVINKRLGKVGVGIVRVGDDEGLDDGIDHLGEAWLVTHAAYCRAKRGRWLIREKE